MTTLLLWAAGILATLVVVGFGAWIAGYTRSKEKLFMAEQSAKLQKELADEKAKQAEIFAKPAGSKPDIIRRL